MHVWSGKKSVAGVTSGPTVAALPPLSHSLIIQTGIPENRTKIILRLKDAARALTPYAHQLPAGTQGLNEQIPEANELCNLIEVCLLHGIRIREFHGIVPFWGLLERLEALYTTHPTTTTNSNSISTSSKSTVSVVSSLSRLRTPLSKARGWIRLVLNRRTVDEVTILLPLTSSSLPFLSLIPYIISITTHPMTLASSNRGMCLYIYFMYMYVDLYACMHENRPCRVY